MTATACATDDTVPAVRPTVHDFVSGAIYSVRQVMALFGKSDQWVRDKIRTKEMSGGKLGGIGPWMVSGESVRALYGTLQLAEDVAGTAVPTEPEAKAVKRALGKLAELNAKKGK